jgi:azurin
MGGILPGVIEPEEGSWAMTDEGANIPLYHLATDDIQFQEYALSVDQRYKSYLHEMIHRGDADKTTNCHGWVFTGGRFLLKGADVERILCDNRYFVVSDPKPNDIVIYRDQARNILHTALVQAVLADGTVITESKWGVDQRFLHLPVDQPYSSTFEYYRTDRFSDHLIRIGTSVAHGDFLDD